MRHSWKHILSLLLAAAMLFALACPGLAAGDGGETTSGPVTVTWEKVDAAPRGLKEATVTPVNDVPYGPDETVRVSIVLEKAPTLRAGFSNKNIGANVNARNYRENIRSAQIDMAELISEKVLGGAKLDVVWNLTLAANLISANVPYKAIEGIKALPGVKEVIIETRYYPDEGVNMSNATGMVGSPTVWSNGYTGAGSVVAIIDTGLDTEHELFQPEAYEHAIGLSEDEVDILTEEDVAYVWDYLNASLFIDDPEDAYVNSKVPFGVNYVDWDLDITHNDGQSEHGSHVAGIAAANRFIKVGEEYKPSLAEQGVFTQGEAPDAQILVMKVFGKNGGAYDSDYMAAIEDAIVLGADSVNLSLGSAAAGFASADSEYSQYVMDAITYTDTVVVMSAGNSADYTRQAVLPYLYSDGVNFDTVGSPASFTNSLSVASVDNDGVTGIYMTAYDNLIFYNETTGYGNEPIATKAGDYEFVYIDGPGVYTDDHDAVVEDSFALLAEEMDLTGKVLICNRGVSYFYQKANAAAAAGAAAVVIANNQSGVIGLVLSQYEYSAPVVSITQDDGMMLLDNATPVETGLDDDVYTGTISIAAEVNTINYDSDYYTMSSFSSWGIPGDLSLKPEITAPGGNIWSVNGLDHGYENMSGTSMAAPQIAGISALMAQYIRENDLCEKTGLSQRQLINSLLMSTAEPLIEEDSNSFYSVLKQGAGLVDADAATNAHSYIIMGDDATATAADGKIKVELGDDPDRTGSYSFSFEINNLTDEDIYYEVDAAFFTQDLFAYYVFDGDGYPVVGADGDYVVAYYTDTWTAPLDANVTWTVDGELYVPGGVSGLDFNADDQFDEDDAVALLEYVVNETPLASGEEDADLDGDGEITTYDAYLALEMLDAVDAVKVPASGSVTIGVDVTLNDIMYYDDCGAYVEGYVYAAELDSEDGAIGVVHSIPVIGYYGSWSEPSMTDVGSRLEYMAGEEEREPYMAPALGEAAKDTEWFGVSYGWTGGTYSLGGNPYDFELDEEYMPERNAVSPDSTIAGVSYSLVRNSAGGLFTVEVDGTEYASLDVAAQYAAYYDDNNDKWYNTRSYSALGLPLAGLEDGQTVELTYMLAPEYYLQADGSIDWDGVSSAAMSYSAVVDGISPEISDIAPVVEDDEFTALRIDVAENRYIAAVVVWNEEGWNDVYYGEPLLEIASAPDAEEGAGMSIVIPNSEDGIDFEAEENRHLMIEVYDYAANHVSYKLNLNEEELEGGPTAIIVTPEETRLIPGMKVQLTATAEPWGTSDEVKWRSQDKSIATVDENGVVTAVDEGVVTIEAHSLINRKVVGSATIEVYYPEFELNASLFDADSQVHFISFNTKELLKGSTDYTVLADTDAGIIDMSWDLFGETVYASSLNDDFTSTLYTLDPSTFELTEIGTDPVLAYLGMAPSLSFYYTLPGNVDMVTAYGSYVVGIDTKTASYSEDALIDLDGAIEGSYVVGIAYIDCDYLSSYGIVYDDYFIIDDLSNVYFFEIMYSDGTLANYGYAGYETGYHFDLMKLGSFNAPVSMDHYNSLYFDGENIFWSRFASYDDDIAEIYMVSVDGYSEAGYPVLGPTVRIGAFADSVWPVGGLIEFFFDEEEPEEPEELTDAEIAARGARCSVLQFADGIEPLSADKGPSGSLNAVIVDDSALDDPEAPAEGAYKIILTADEANHNGLFTVEYNAEELELVSAESPITEYSVIREEEGKVTIGYATLDEVNADDEILNLSFNLIEVLESNVTVTTEELGDEAPGEAEEVIVGSLEYGEPEWIWADDYSSATAVFTCVDDETITKEVEATVTSVTTPAMVAIPGKIVYTATVEFNGDTYTDEVTVQIDALVPDSPIGGGYAPGGDDNPGGGSISDQPSDPPFPFVDVDDSDWYYNDVYDMYKAGYIKGTSETTYEPDEDISRAQIVLILYRIDGENKVESGVPFTDVATGAWYYDAVAWANAKGIVKGISATEFDPDTAVTREQFAAIIYRYAQFRGAAKPSGNSLTGFSDAGSVSEWAAEAMNWCVANKLIQGTGDNALDPLSTASRAQAAAIYNRMIKLFA